MGDGRRAVLRWNDSRVPSSPWLKSEKTFPAEIV
jgi:hypothetical protein